MDEATPTNSTQAVAEPLTPGMSASQPPAHHDDRHAAAPLSAAVRVVSGLTLVSRFMGLARDIITAKVFGVTVLGSAFQAAYSFPNFFRRLFGEGALSAAFLPEYTLLRRDHPDLANQLASITMWMLTLVTGVLTLLMEVVLVVLLIAAPADSDRVLSFKLMMLMLPMMPAVCITAILGGMLQAHGRFGPPAAAPIILNVFQIAAGAGYFLAWYDSQPAAFIVGGAAVASSAVQIIWSLHAMRGKVRWTRAWAGAREHSRKVLSRFVPAMLGLGTIQLNSLMDMLFAMWPVWVGPTVLGYALTMDEGSNAILRYTQTIYQFPLGVFGIAVATAVFPLLSRSSDNNAEFVQHLRRGLRLSLFIGLPASVGLFIVRTDILNVIYGGGGTHAFSKEDIARAAAVLEGFSPAIWAYSLNHVFTRAFYAKGDTVTPMRLALGAVGLNFVLNCVLTWQFREAGLAWSTATSAVIQCLILGFLTAKCLKVRPFDSLTTIALARIALASTLMGAAVWAVDYYWPARGSWTSGAVKLAALVSTGGGAYALLAFLFKLPEMRWLLHRGPRGSGGAAGMSFE